MPDGYAARLGVLVFQIRSEIKLKAQLELPRVKGRSWLAKVPAVAAPLAESIYHVVERISRRFVKSVEKIKCFAYQIKADPFPKADLSRNANVGRKVTMSDSHVTTQVAVCRKNSG